MINTAIWKNREAIITARRLDESDDLVYVMDLVPAIEGAGHTGSRNWIVNPANIISVVAP